MTNSAIKEPLFEGLEEPGHCHRECEIVSFKSESHDCESLSESFINELDIWARQSIASNGWNLIGTDIEMTNRFSNQQALILPLTARK